MSHTIAGKTSNTAENIKNIWRTTDQAYRDALILCGRKSFDIDAAADSTNKRCSLFIGAEQDATKSDWFYPNVSWAWCNPPFDLKREFLDRAYNQRYLGSTCMMIPFEPTTKWWLEYVHGKASVVYIPDGRYNFYHPETGEETKGVAFASCFVVYTSITMPTQYVHFIRGLQQAS
jgi:phage N-6-adenine-methyltransferase